MCTAGAGDSGCYTCHMTKLLKEVVADVRALPAEEQDHAAEVLLVFMRELLDDWGGEV